MWDLETIRRINEKAANLAAQGRPSRDAQAEIGIKVMSGNGGESVGKVLLFSDLHCHPHRKGHEKAREDAPPTFREFLEVKK